MENWVPDICLPESIQVRLLEKKQRLDAMRPLPAAVLNRLMDDFSVEWTYNSNSIEGNTLSLRETRIVLRDGLTIGGKTLREHFEVHNHFRAIQWVESLVSLKYKLKVVDILELHRLVMQSIDHDFAGFFRTGRVRITGANFVPPNPLKVPKMMDELVDWVNSNLNTLDPITLATVFHHRFVWIHPFFDGNGRTVRLVMNLILMRFGFPPAIILKTDKAKYYAALNQANNGNFQKLMLLISQAEERSLDIYLSSVGAGDSDYEPLSQLALEPSVPYGQEYLSLLARRGKLEAFKEGRVWYSSMEAVNRYLLQEN